MKILAIDTSGKTASVAITDEGRLLWEKTVYTKLTHSQVILPMVSRALEETGFDYPDIDCAAVANGPGSYTGLRIGIGAVKGLCMGQPGLKAAGVSTLLSLAYNCEAFEGSVIPVMRARPGIVYAAEFMCTGGKLVRLTEDRVCREADIFAELDTDCPTMLVGDHAARIKEDFFADEPAVRVAAGANVLQRASSLCMAVEQDNGLMCSGDELEVSYLQATKAEKDKAHRDK